MKKCKYRTACKADILEAEPDVKKHEDRSYDNRYDSVSSHLIADSSGNILRCDQTCIYIKIFLQCLIQCFSFLKIQRTCFDHYLISSLHLGRLYILITCHCLNNRCYLGIDLLDIHLFIEGYIGRSTAGKLQTVIHGFVTDHITVDQHSYRSAKDQDNGNSKEDFSLSNEIYNLTFLGNTIEFRVTNTNCVYRINNKPGYNQCCKHGDHDTHCQRVGKSLNRTGAKPHQHTSRDQCCNVSIKNSGKRFAESTFDRCMDRKACRDLLTDSGVDDNIGIHCHTNAQDDTCNTRKRKGDIKGIQCDQH